MHKITYRDPILSWWTSIAKLPSFFQKKKHSAESMQGIISTQVNETKVTLRNAFILDLFASGGQKESKYNEKAPFGDFLQKHDLSVKP